MEMRILHQAGLKRYESFQVGVLGINIAQRYSVVVTADQPFGNYTMYADYLCGHRDLFLVSCTMNLVS